MARPVVPAQPSEIGSREGRIVFLLGAGCATAVCAVLVAVGVGTWFVVGRLNERAARAEVPAAERATRAAEAPAETPEPLPEAPPPRRRPPIPPFVEPVNPYKPGTQTRLRELRSVELPVVQVPGDRLLVPRNPFHAQMLHSPKHGLLFVRNIKGVWVYDLKADKVHGTRAAAEVFTDMSLSPDEGALFVADYGDHEAGYSRKPLRPSRVQRFDLAARTWAEHEVSIPFNEIRAVSADRVLLACPSMTTTLNAWEAGGVRELAGTVLGGPNLEYSPRTGHLYRGFAPQLHHARVDGASFDRFLNHYNADFKILVLALSQDGARLYFGRVQLNAEKVEEVTGHFPEVIYAGSRDVAFGARDYYDARTGGRLGAYPFSATSYHTKTDWFASPAVAVCPDGLSVWIIDRDKNVARQFALEGDK